MMKMILFVLIFSLSTLLSEDIRTIDGFFDRFYIYGYINNNKGLTHLDKNIKESSSGINIVKKINLPAYDNKIQIDAIAIFDSYKKGSKFGSNRERFDFNELYSTIRINDIAFEIGRKYIDFSMAKTYTLLNFISKPLNPIDKEDSDISKMGIDGVNFGYTPSFLSGSKVNIYLYDEHIFDGKENDFRGVVELNLNNLAVQSNYFIGSSKNEDILGASINANINLDTSIYGEAKYTNNDFNYLVGLNYSAYKNFSFALERIILNDGSNRDSLLRKLDNNESLLMEHYYKGLSSKDYINGYLKYSFPDKPSSLYILGIHNMLDDSSKLTIKADYWYGRLRFYSQLTRNTGNKKSEFGSFTNSEFKIHISLNLVDKTANNQVEYSY